MLSCKLLRVGAVATTIKRPNKKFGIDFIGTDNYPLTSGCGHIICSVVVVGAVASTTKRPNNKEKNRPVTSRWSTCEWHAGTHKLRLDCGLAIRAIRKVKNRPIASRGSICKWHAGPHSCESMVDLQLGQLQTTTKKSSCKCHRVNNPSCESMVYLQVACGHP